jgi:hypothetical protein
VGIVECLTSKPCSVFHVSAPTAPEQFSNGDDDSGRFPSWNRTLSERLTPPVVAQNKKRVSEILQKPVFVQLVPAAGLEPATS